MIDALSMELARKIKAKVPDHPSSIEVLKYSLSFILNALFIVALTMIIALVTGHELQAALALVAFAILRQLSGGLHLKSGTICILITTILMTALSYSKFNSHITVWLTVISLGLVLVFAPSNLNKQTNFPKKFYPYLKIISLLMVSINLLIQSDVLAGTFLVQALTLIRIRR
ncbi:putative regulator protein [compost metagenome]